MCTYQVLGSHYCPYNKLCPIIFRFDNDICLKDYRPLNQQMSPLSFSAANLNTISGDMSNIMVEVGH